MDLQAITLDLDDTLWPVLPTLINAEKVLGQWLGKNAPATAANLDEATRTRLRNALITEFPGRGHDMSWLRAELIRRALVENGENPELAVPAFDTFHAARQQVSCYDEVHEVLAQWASRYTLIAISNGNADINLVGLGDYFTAAISAHEQDFAKPDPRMFEAAWKIADAPPEKILHIGDDWQMDIEPALKLNMPAAWVRRPDLKHKAAPPAAKNVPVYANLREIDQLINS